MPWNQLFADFPLSSGSCILSAPSSAVFPEPWGKGCDTNVLFRAEHSTVTMNIQSAVTAVHCKEKPGETTLSEPYRWSFTEIELPGKGVSS